MRTRSGTHPRAQRGRAVRLRVVLLAAAWSVSGLWAVGHVLTHEGHDHGAHVESAADLTALVVTHGHGHVHPSPLPDASITKVPELEAPALLAATPDVAAQDAGRRWPVLATRPQAGPAPPDALGPRAPPIS